MQPFPNLKLILDCVAFAPAASWSWPGAAALGAALAPDPLRRATAGPKDQGTGTAAGWDLITMRRIHVIQPDGTIKRKNFGWLPR